MPKSILQQQLKRFSNNQSRSKFTSVHGSRLKGYIISMGSIISYPPPGFHTKLDTRSAAAYLDIPIAELRRLNRTGTILGERSLLRILYPELLSTDKTGDNTFEQFELEDYLEKLWVVAE